MKRPLGILLTLLFMALLGLWLILVAVASDYHEATVLLLGVVWLLTTFVLSWNTSKRVVKIGLVIILVAVMATVGALAIKAGRYRTEVRKVIAENVLVEVARQLRLHIDEDFELPDCPWVCMIQKLQDADGWPGLEIPYEGHDQSIRFDSIPRNDEWGCRYHYVRLGKEDFRLKCSGPDRRFGTDDDIVVKSNHKLPDKPRALPVFGTRPTAVR